MTDAKIYVPVKVEFTEDGKATPVEIAWTDGRVFEIDKVLDIRPAAALKAGGQGTRFTVRIKDRETYLFFERAPSNDTASVGRWFVEKK